METQTSSQQQAPLSQQQQQQQQASLSQQQASLSQQQQQQTPSKTSLSQQQQQTPSQSPQAPSQSSQQLGRLIPVVKKEEEKRIDSLDGYDDSISRRDYRYFENDAYRDKHPENIEKYNKNAISK